VLFLNCTSLENVGGAPPRYLRFGNRSLHRDKWELPNGWKMLCLFTIRGHHRRSIPTP